MANHCLEETITLAETGKTYKYSLSNNINDIETAIQSRTGYILSLSDVVPKINPGLSVSVKKMMTKYNVEFSMTPFEDNSYSFIVINRRVQDQWYSTFFAEIDGGLVWIEDW